jgi:uncharacterized protein YutE (UPF0331/DUF86 family)/predicted nucleotidyltransferase
MTSKFQLLPPDIKERLEKLPERLASVEGLTALWLFGSFARGEATPVSDVDLAYLPDERLQGKELDGFETQLYTLISGTLRTDDFTFANLQRAPARLIWHVMTEGRPLMCRDDNACAALKEHALQVYPDCRPYLQERWQAVDDWLEGKSMAVEKGRVYALLEGIREELALLREMAALSRDTYLKDKRTQRLAERCLQRAAEGAISIGNHFIARMGWRAPQDYADIFRILGQSQVLPWDLADAMMDLARFRNLLVHVYWTIDHQRVFDALPARIETLEAFARQVAQWLRDQPDR